MKIQNGDKLVPLYLFVLARFPEPRWRSVYLEFQSLTKFRNMQFMNSVIEWLKIDQFLLSCTTAGTQGLNMKFSRGGAGKEIRGGSGSEGFNWGGADCGELHSVRVLCQSFTLGVVYFCTTAEPTKSGSDMAPLYVTTLTFWFPCGDWPAARFNNSKPGSCLSSRIKDIILFLIITIYADSCLSSAFDLNPNGISSRRILISPSNPRPFRISLHTTRSQSASETWRPVALARGLQ